MALSDAIRSVSIGAGETGPQEMSGITRALFRVSEEVLAPHERMTAKDCFFRMRQEVAQELGEGRDHRATQVAAALKHAVCHSAGVRSTRRAREATSLFGAVLARGVGDCVGLASVYVALSRDLHLPVHAVVRDLHVMMAVVGEDEVLISDTTDDRPAPSSTPLHAGMSGRGTDWRCGELLVLGDRHFLSIVLTNRAAYVHASCGNWTAVARDMRLALRLCPTDPVVLQNAGMMGAFILRAASVPPNSAIATRVPRADSDVAGADPRVRRR